MNIKEIKEMINLMNENSLIELEIEKDGTRIRLKKGLSGVETPTSVIIERQTTTPALTKDKLDSGESGDIANAVEIKAPMVGTFYRAPSPEAPPYVEVGTTIEPGAVICIIEAMKLMNEIKSEIRGKILEIFVDNAEPVEFGQSLLLVEPL